MFDFEIFDFELGQHRIKYMRKFTKIDFFIISKKEKIQNASKKLFTKKPGN